MSDDSNVITEGDTASLPQWARDAISRANSEAADRRVQIKKLEQEKTDLNNQLASALDAKTAAETAAGTTNVELQKLQIALDAGVPGERVRSIAERLRGSSEDELKADAEALVREFGLNAPPAQVRATDPSQARGGNAAPVPNTPQAEFAQMFGELDIFKR